MQSPTPLRDEDEGILGLDDDPEHATDSLMEYDSERRRVTEAVSDFNQRPLDEDEEEEHAVPTEMLQEDMDAVLELPPHFTTGRTAEYM